MSQKYTEKNEKELITLCKSLFKKRENEICLLATGSFGKSQLTEKSDIDIMCIIDTSVANVETYKKTLQEKLTRASFTHEFEFYPFESLDEWKWIAKYSTLYCTDLFFAKFLFGKKALYTQLMAWIDGNQIDYLNQKSYITYNLFYRKKQLATQPNETNLKYQEGGLRDYQFIKWISWRLAQCSSYEPEKIVSALEKESFVTKKESTIVLEYIHAILAYKWYLEKNDNEKIQQTKATFEACKKLFLPVFEDIKMRLINKYATNDEKKWREVVLALYHDGESNSTSIDALSEETEESFIYLSTMLTKNIEVISKNLSNSSEYWTVRAGAALNENTPNDLLKKIDQLSYPDMADIKSFISKNKNY